MSLFNGNSQEGKDSSIQLQKREEDKKLSCRRLGTRIAPPRSAVAYLPAGKKREGV